MVQNPRIPEKNLGIRCDKNWNKKKFFGGIPESFQGFFCGIPQNPSFFDFLFCNPGGVQLESQLDTHAFFLESEEKKIESK